MPALVLTKELRVFLEENRLTQKYWRDYFAEFIIDTLWEDLRRSEMTEKALKEAEKYLKRSLRAQKRLGYSADVEPKVYQDALQATARAFDTLLGAQPAVVKPRAVVRSTR